MLETDFRRLSEVVPALAPEGANDRKWFLVEHLLESAKTDVQIACDYLQDIEALPENSNEQEVAANCLCIVKRMLRNVLRDYAWFRSYLHGTDVPERISRKEL